MNQIAKSTILTIVDRIDIVTYIQKYLPLKRAGNNYIALCPFHQEKTPSFSVNPRDQYYYCFGCQSKGNVISFVMQYRKLEFREALEELAQQAGVTLQQDNSSYKNEHEELYATMELAKIFFAQTLHSHDEAKQYLEKRGFSRTVQEHYGLGYAPSGNSLVKALTEKNIPLARIQSLGLANKKTPANDFYQSRIIFPIYNRKGRIIGFGGRIINNDSESPKYINSPESPIYSKKKELYLSHLINRDITTTIVVEGYFDALQVHVSSIANVVAVLGTALTEEHVQYLQRVSKQIVFCFDSDNAGIQALYRTLTVACQNATPDCEFKFLIISNGKDPDEVILKHGRSEFEKQLSSSLDIAHAIDFILSTKYPEDSLAMKALKLSKAKEFVNQTRNTSVQAILKSSLESIYNLPFDMPIIEKHTSHRPTNFSSVTRVLYCLYHFPTLAQIINIERYLPVNLGVENALHIQVLKNLISYLQDNPGLTHQELLVEINSPDSQVPDLDIILSLATNYNDLNFQKDQLLQEFEDIIKFWIVESNKLRIKNLTSSDSPNPSSEEVRQALADNNVKPSFTLDAILRNKLLNQ
ncbi:MAG: DNA primase [Methylacidiphilales bacterium]|nr:DNA primase [Candidatus Methylacidiphilales bacterium]